MSRVPDGANKLPYISAISPSDLLSPEHIASLVQSAPAGSYWHVGGEPNKLPGYVAPQDFAAVFHYYYTNIKYNDPSAKIAGPGILNWDSICIGCGGVYMRGETWLRDFISAYERVYDQKPPVDVWTIDAYPIDWDHTPNQDPQNPAYAGTNILHSDIAIDQLMGMRQYLDGIPEYENTPIWITEIAIHVGYGFGQSLRDGWEFDSPLNPVGPYHWDKMSDYVNAVLDWLEANAASHKIDRWFFYKSLKDIVNVGSDGYMGITFFGGPGQGEGLNCLGEVYRARSLHLPPVKCDADGNTVLAD